MTTVREVIGFDFLSYHGDFSLKGKIPMVIVVWVVQ
jgi:hypothetical protein